MFQHKVQHSPAHCSTSSCVTTSSCENGLFRSVLLKEVVIEPSVKLECVPKFCYLGGVEEAARARVRCAWAKFKELSPIPTARGASYCIKGKIYIIQGLCPECIDIWD